MAGNWAMKLRFEPRGLDLSIKAEIRLSFEAENWALKVGRRKGTLKEGEKFSHSWKHRSLPKK